MLRACCLLLLFLPGLASAQQVFKCVDQHGKVKYSQSRCQDEPQLPKPPAPPEPPVPERVEKVSPEERDRAATPDVRREAKPVGDARGRPDVTEMTRQHEQ